MRAFIIRTPECIEFLNSIEIDKNNKYDQEFWLFISDESFHGELKGRFFKFMDYRVPNIKIPLNFVEIEL